MNEQLESQLLSLNVKPVVSFAEQGKSSESKTDEEGFILNSASNVLDNFISIVNELVQHAEDVLDDLG